MWECIDFSLISGIDVNILVVNCVFYYSNDLFIVVLNREFLIGFILWYCFNFLIVLLIELKVG